MKGSPRTPNTDPALTRETEKALKSMRNGKAVGEEGVPNTYTGWRKFGWKVAKLQQKLYKNAHCFYTYSIHFLKEL